MKLYVAPAVIHTEDGPQLVCEDPDLARRIVADMPTGDAWICPAS